MSINNQLISLKDICFGYHDEEVLCSVNLEVNKGDFLGLIGPNGSGKTTLLRIMLGLEKSSSGEVLLFGSPIKQFKEWSKIGYIAQKVTHVQTKIPVTVREIASLDKHARDEDIDKALAAVGLTDKQDKMITELSGGQQQRAFIAKALASNPELLILDEPTTGVDVGTQDEFYNLLSQLNRNGLTLIMVSHDIDVVVNEVNKLVCLNKKIVYQGPPNEFAKDEQLEKLYGSTRRMIIHRH